MSTRLTRRLLPAAAVVAALAGWLSPLTAQQLSSPDLAYHAPPWWITAVVQGKQATLQTGVPENDRRLNVWLIGFGYGLGVRCGLQGADSHRLEPTLKQGVAADRALGKAAQSGIQDGQRFAELNGCTGEDAAAARRNIASIVTALAPAQNSSGQVAQSEADRSQSDRSPSDSAQPQPGVVPSATTVRNRSSSRILIVRISETWDNNWGIDRLGNDVLESCASYRIPLAGPRTCIFDVQVTYVGRRVEERRNVDLCANPEVSFDGSSAN